MREIKFRAWDKINKRMKDNIHFLDSCNEYLTRPNEWHCMQYTGLKDKNEKEIYEGDIVKQEYRNGWWVGKIVWLMNYYFWGFYVQVINGDYIGGLDITDKTSDAPELENCIGFYSLRPVMSELIEKTGNIYENPELLEGQEND